MTRLSLKLVYVFLTEPNVKPIGETLYLSSGLFLESLVNFSVPKSLLSNCNPLVFKSGPSNFFLNVWKTKRIAKFDGLEPRRYEDNI